MPHAAVPAYVGQQFVDCPPGHRFNLYFPIWRDDWIADKNGKAPAIRACTSLPPTAKKLLAALLARQRAQADAVSALVLEAKGLSPFATGLGNEHPVENGFAFLSPYGLAYLAGSGVKGVLRAAAQELAGEANPPLDEADIEALFGKEPPPGCQDAERGALSFWDVFPDCAALSVEIMTPHHGGYYQNGGTPNDAGQPNPIPFLAVPPGAKFQFVVQCDERRLPEALASRWQDVVQTIFIHACDWRGFGAKTAVGYGALAFDAAAAARAQEEKWAAAAAAAREAALVAMTPNQRVIEDFQTTCAARLEQLRGGKDRPNTVIHQKARELAKAALEGSDWTISEKQAVANAIEEWIPRLIERMDTKEIRKSLKLAALRTP